MEGMKGVVYLAKECVYLVEPMPEQKCYTGVGDSPSSKNTKGYEVALQMEVFIPSALSSHNL